MIKILLHAAFLYACFFSSPILSASEEAKVGFDIRFYDKRVYYVNRDDVEIKLTITNRSPVTYNFRIADVKAHSVDFEVKTQTNRFLPHSEKYTIEKRTNQAVLYRSVSLEPGEELGFVLPLGSFISLNQPGIFTVQAVFYPELMVSKNAEAIRSNSLTLNMRPALSKEMEGAIEEDSGEALKREPLAPDEVVRYMLLARQKSQWEKYFLYLDLVSLYERNPSREARYKRMSMEERIAAIEKFRKDLMQETAEQEILVIPRSFEILETSYKGSRGQVTVLERFAYSDYTERKRYTYFLEKRDTVWIIYDYAIENLGTE